MHWLTETTAGATPVQAADLGQAHVRVGCELAVELDLAAAGRRAGLQGAEVEPGTPTGSPSAATTRCSTDAWPGRSCRAWSQCEAVPGARAAMDEPPLW